MNLIFPLSISIWIAGPQESDNREREVIEKPSFDKFLSSPEGLSEHLDWQLRATVCTDKVREITETVIGNLDEDGYLTVTLEEIAQNGGFEMDDVEEALAIVQEFDPLGVGARNLRECLTIQLKALDPQNTLAQQIVSECLAAAANRGKGCGGGRRCFASEKFFGESAQGNRARAESARRTCEARHGFHSQTRSAPRVALQQDAAAIG